MKRWIALTVILFMSCSTFAGIKSYVDRTDIHTNETFTLVVELDEFTNESPDLSLLPEEVLILGSSKYHRSSTVNGVSETQLGWKIQLMVKQPGVYTLPAISVGNQSSTPIQINVKESTDNFSTDDEVQAIMLKSEVDKDSVFVQEQLLFTVKLYRSVQTQYASLTEPVIENALIEKVGEDSQYESIIDGKRYLILERKYAVFPQKSGEITVPKIIFSADVVSRQNSSGFGRLLGRTRPVTVSTDEKVITVKPYPANHQGLWLPSKKLSIEGRWSDPKDKVAGEPSTWTITVKGTGLHENQLPELSLPNIEGIKWYPDTAQKDREITSDGIVGQRVERIAVVPTHEGRIELPEIKIRWFNTTTEKYENAVLPAQVINVKANPEQATLVAPVPQNAQTIEPSVTQVVASPLWQWLTLVFALLWLITLMLYLMQRVAHREAKPTETGIENNVPKANLIAACKNKDNKAVYQWLIRWFNSVNGEQSLQQHLAPIENTQLKQSLMQLEQSLFSAQSANWSDYKNLMDGLPLIERSFQTSSSKPKSPLPELYPQS